MESLKVLHRIYFGFDGKQDIYLDYLETWKKELPNYQIKYWSTENLPMDLNEYTQALFKEKDHAFLSDYFRWWILREYGGIYLDGDIEVINGKKFNQLVEELETSQEYDAFIGLELKNQGYTAHSMASKKNSELTNFMCKVYENIGVLRHWRRKKWFVAPLLVDLYFYEKGIAQENLGFIETDQPIIEGHVKIYPVDYFSPVASYCANSINNFQAYSSNTCLCHHFVGSWTLDPKIQKKRNIRFKDYLEEQTKKKPKIIRIFLKIIQFIIKILKSIPQKIKTLWEI